MMLLLALAACSQAPPNSYEADLPTSNSTTATPPVGEMPMDQGQASPEPAPAPPPAQSGGQRERFVVCPGNPRCPPAGSRPKER
jgi:hypothetical protein